MCVCGEGRRPSCTPTPHLVLAFLNRSPEAPPQAGRPLLQQSFSKLSHRDYMVVMHCLQVTICVTLSSSAISRAVAVFRNLKPMRSLFAFRLRRMFLLLVEAYNSRQALVQLLSMTLTKTRMRLLFVSA